MTKTRNLADLGGGFIQAGTGAVQRTVESKLQDVVSVLDFIPPGTDTANTDCTGYIQAAIDAVTANGGGTVFFPAGSYRLVSILDTSRSSLPAGYVPNNEQRRAHKALIIYNTQNIALVGEAGAVLDRSGDNAIDTEYSQYASTVYISKSNNVRVQGISFKGYQVDLDLLNDTKDNTSGNHIAINSGSSNVIIDGCDLLDGTNGIAVGINRTASAQSIDPSLDPCTDVAITNCDIKNNEHGVLLADCQRVHVSNCSIRRFPRGGSDGAVQRGIYVHSASDVAVSNVTISGIYKNGILVTNYQPIRNVNFSNIHIVDCYTEADVFSKRGTYYNTTYESIGLRIANEDPTFTRSSLTFDSLSIVGFATGVAFDPHGLVDSVTISNSKIRSTLNGIATFDYRPSPDVSDGTIRGLSLIGLDVQVIEDAINFPNALPNTGITLQPLTTQQAKDVIINGCVIRSRNRNARVFNCDASIVGSTFEQLTGYAGSRNYDLLCGPGQISLSNNTYGTQGAVNKGNDVPSASDIANVSDVSSLTALAGPVSTFTSNLAEYTFTLRAANAVAGQGNHGASLGFAKLGSLYGYGGAISVKQGTADADQCGLSFWTGASSNSNSNLRESLQLSYDGSLSVYKDVFSAPSASVDPVNNGQLVTQATSNTQLTFKYKGSDGVVRSANLTLS